MAKTQAPKEPVVETPVVQVAPVVGNEVSLDGVKSGTEVKLADGTVITHY